MGIVVKTTPNLQILLLGLFHNKFIFIQMPDKHLQLVIITPLYEYKICTGQTKLNLSNSQSQIIHCVFIITILQTYFKILKLTFKILKLDIKILLLFWELSIKQFLLIFCSI